MSKLTPMMTQYLKIKEEYQDSILFFRLGDFYEMFFDDAKLASRELEISLTGRNCGQEERAPMCGIPYHAAEGYISKLVSKGYKVAICEQGEIDESRKGIVERTVTRVITPGTVLNEDLLNERKTNYMCAVYKKGEQRGITLCELSTGHMMATSFEDDKNLLKLVEEMYRFKPVEAVVNLEAYENETLKKYALEHNVNLELLNDTFFEEDFTRKEVYSKFAQKSADLNSLMSTATGALLYYLKQTQHMSPDHIIDIDVYESSQFMEIDSSAHKNLEITENTRDRKKKGSLLWVLDDTKTTMGSRTIKSWLIRPLLNCLKINERQNAVEDFINNMPMREDLREAMINILDVERITGRIIMGTANARDLVRLKVSLSYLPEVKEILKNSTSELLQKQNNEIEDLSEITELIERGIVDEPPLILRDGGIIKEGFCEELDELKRIRDGGHSIIVELETAEKEKTGIKNLRIAFNKVFGYYIEVSKGNIDKVPEHYVRKQTTVNTERYITDDLKKVEDSVLGASEKSIALEYKLFQEIRQKIASQVDKIQKTARAIGVIDALASLACVAAKNNFVRPEVDLSDKLFIKEGRHPVVEQVTHDLFVPNDTILDCDLNRLAIITGPNMAGKSTYMRQIALIAIMAQMGSFVPAKSCRVGIVDKLYTRIGASDDLNAGQSTFMVEMSEVAEIISGATQRSLLILDEIGRGTSTFDGLSIAWAVLEYCASKLKAKTLFATHYHELTDIEDKIEGVLNYRVAVKKRGDDIIFIRKIVRGGADESYGIEVAKLAGVPGEIINRAKKILAGLESGEGEIKIRGTQKRQHSEDQLGFDSIREKEIINQLKLIDVNTLSPIEALSELYKLSQLAKETE